MDQDRAMVIKELCGELEGYGSDHLEELVKLFLDAVCCPVPDRSLGRDNRRGRR